MIRTIAMFVFPDFQIMDACGPITAFEIAGRLGSAGSGGDGYRLVLVSTAGGAIRSSSGVALDTVGIAAAGPIDTLMVAGGNGSRDALRDGAAMAWLRSAASDVRRCCSVCSGAFLLAGAGLLDGRRATTHWARAALLARMFPAVRVEPDRIHIRDGSVWTSAGISAGIDLALALVAEDLGEAVAREVARDMVVYYRRPGGQSQFSALADLGGEGTPFAALFDWVRAHLDRRLTVEVLADQAGMSPRNFSRAFARAIGVSPARAVERLRLEVARERVENSTIPIETIARATGFHDPERMRRAFVRAFGQPAQAMRRLRAGSAQGMRRGRAQR
eukprot:gene5616-5675_t